MNVRDNINNGVYENKLPYPVKPRKPVLKAGATPVEIRQYAADVENYDTYVTAWRTKLDEYNREKAELMLKFRADVEFENGTLTNKKASVLWNKAWERGHSEGLVGVLNVYEDLAELIL